MKQCKCGSYAINPHLHGRQPGEESDLCDVCYWRTKATKLMILLEVIRIAVQHPKEISQIMEYAKESNSDLSH